jgi:uncharacterized membrane protein
MLGIALASTLFSAWLTYIELNVLHAICIWCVVSAVDITVILLLTIALILRSDRQEAAHFTDAGREAMRP